MLSIYAIKKMRVLLEVNKYLNTLLSLTNLTYLLFKSIFSAFFEQQNNSHLIRYSNTRIVRSEKANCSGFVP